MSNQEKADLFTDHLEKVFQPHMGSSVKLDSSTDEIEDDFPIKYTSPKEIRKEINCLNPKKAPELDHVTVRMLKELPHKEIMKLTHLFNASFRLRFVPRQWETAEVITIPKPGKPLHEVTSYRPISLLSVIASLRKNFN